MKKNNILKTFELYDFNKIKNLLKMLNIDDKFDYIQYLNLEKIIIYFYKLNYASMRFRDRNLIDATSSMTSTSMTNSSMSLHR